MLALVASIHAFAATKAWMAVTSTAMTEKEADLFA